jgi:hypothetical protein
VIFTQDSSKAFRTWFPDHMSAFLDVPWPSPRDDRIGFYPGLAATLIRNGITDLDSLREITRRMVTNDVKTFGLRGHVNRLIATAQAIRKENGSVSEFLVKFGTKG